MTLQLKGRCLCGCVEYLVDNEFKYAVNCHCSKCRRATGAAFKSLAGIESTKLTLIKGANHLLIYGKDADHDTRCSECGSLLFSTVRQGEYVHVALGTLEDTPSIRPTAHIFVGSKAPWFNITDNLPQHQEFG